MLRLSLRTVFIQIPGDLQLMYYYVLRSRKPRIRPGGIRCADHATPSIRKSWYYFAKKRRSLGRHSPLADQSHGVSLCASRHRNMQAETNPCMVVVRIFPFYYTRNIITSLRLFQTSLEKHPFVNMQKSLNTRHQNLLKTRVSFRNLETAYCLSYQSL
jgi:hypothetical protein